MTTEKSKGAADAGACWKDRKTTRTIGGRAVAGFIRTFTGTTGAEYDEFLDWRAELDGVEMRRGASMPTFSDPATGYGGWASFFHRGPAEGLASAPGIPAGADRVKVTGIGEYDHNSTYRRHRGGWKHEEYRVEASAARMDARYRAGKVTVLADGPPTDGPDGSPAPQREEKAPAPEPAAGEAAAGFGVFSATACTEPVSPADLTPPPVDFPSIVVVFHGLPVPRHGADTASVGSGGEGCRESRGEAPGAADEPAPADPAPAPQGEEEEATPEPAAPDRASLPSQARPSATSPTDFWERTPTRTFCKVSTHARPIGRANDVHEVTTGDHGAVSTHARPIGSSEPQGAEPPRESKRAPSPRQPAPASPPACLTLTIGRRAYGLGVVTIGSAYTLESDQGAAYEVTIGDHGAECTCPDFQRRSWANRDGCKHTRGLRAAGLLAPLPDLARAGTAKV